MSVSLLAVVVDCHDPHLLANFWATALSRDLSERNPDEFQVSDPSHASTSLYFMKVPEPKLIKNRVHLDVSTDDPVEVEVQRLLTAGASLIDVRKDPDTFDNPDSWTVLADPEGNEFCVTSSTLPGWP